MEKEKITFNIDKNKDFSEWYTEIVKKAELADIRYNVKGFVVFQPWSVLTMEKMFKVKVQQVNTLIMPNGKKKAYIKLFPETPALDVATQLGLM